MTPAAVIEVQLTRDEYAIAVIVAALRDVKAGAANLHHAYRFNGDGLSINVLGAAGEQAVAKAYHAYWPGTGDVGGVDIPPNIQVRTSDDTDDIPAAKSLILHRRDPDDHVFVLATLTGVRLFRIHGWILGRDGKRQEYWRTDVRCPAFFIPIAALQPPQNLEVRA